MNWRGDLLGARDMAVALIGGSNVDLLEANGITTVYTTDLLGPAGERATLSPVHVRPAPELGRDHHLVIVPGEQPIPTRPASSQALAELREALAVADLNGSSLGVELDAHGLITRAWAEEAS